MPATIILVMGLLLAKTTETINNHTKKPAITVFRNIPELKEVTFENRYKTICFFISVFGINLYI
jgi:hypothetical protein